MNCSYYCYGTLEEYLNVEEYISVISAGVWERAVWTFFRLSNFVFHRRAWNDKLQKLMLYEYPIFEDLVTGRNSFVPFSAGRSSNIEWSVSQHLRLRWLTQKLSSEWTMSLRGNESKITASKSWPPWTKLSLSLFICHFTHRNISQDLHRMVVAIQISSNQYC